MGRHPVLCGLGVLLLLACAAPRATVTAPGQSPAPLGVTAEPSSVPPQPSAPEAAPFPALSFPELPLDLLVRTLPEACMPAGSAAYVEPAIDDGVDPTWRAEEPVLERGTVITISSASDEVNGDTSGVGALLASPGPDGVSLREALQAANQDPGEYTIRFAPGLKGATIEVGSWDHNELPSLAGGSVTVNGDVDSDGEPDVTLANGLSGPGEGRAAFGLRVQSGHNTLYALRLLDFTNAVLMQPAATHLVLSGNTLSHLLIEGGNGIALGGGDGSDGESAKETHNTWADTRIVDNTFRARGGMSFGLARSSGDRIENLLIRGNRITISGDEADVYDGILLSAGYGPDSTGNVIENVLIAGNTIEGKPNTGVGLLCGFGGSGGNRIRRVHIIGNRVRMEREEILSTFGIAIFAGYWVNTEGNTISDVVVAGNDVEGYQESLCSITSGAVGSSGNRIESVRVSGNRFRVTRPVRENGVPVNAVSIATGDGATDYADPSLQPVVYPDDNVVRDVWVSDNVIEGFGGAGVSVSTGVLGVQRNELRGVYIVGNEIRGVYPGTGIMDSGVCIFHGGSGGNRISEVFIQQNTIEQANQREGFIGEEFFSGGIVVATGNGSQGNSTEDVWLVGNEVASPAPGITVVGGWGDPRVGPAVDNRIAGVRVWCNSVSERPLLLEALFPGVKGINVAGGFGLARGNHVEDVDVRGNTVAGVAEDVSLWQDAGEGSEGNEASVRVK